MSERVFAPGPNWQPPTKQVPRSATGQADADYKNSLAGGVARANSLDFGHPGLHLDHAFYPNPIRQADPGTQIAFIRLLDALLPGTPDLPGEAVGVLKSNPTTANSRLQDTSVQVKVINFSTSIYGPVGGLAIAHAVVPGSLYVAIGSAS